MLYFEFNAILLFSFVFFVFSFFITRPLVELIFVLFVVLAQCFKTKTSIFPFQICNVGRHLYIFDSINTITKLIHWIQHSNKTKSNLGSGCHTFSINFPNFSKLEFHIHKMKYVLLKLILHIHSQNHTNIVNLNIY